MEQTVHGVKVTTLRAVEETVRSDPAQGPVTFQVHDVWSGPAQHHTKTGDITGPMVNHHRAIPHEVRGDEPEPLLGTDKSISPVELLQTAITHCVGTTLSYHAGLHEVELKRLEVSAEGTIDLQGFLGTNPNVNARLSKIRLAFLIESEANSTKLNELIAIAVKHSPVSDTVKHGTQLAASLV